MLVISSFQEWHFEIHHNLPGEVREESLELPRWSPAEMPNIGTGGTCRILHTKVTINTHTHTPVSSPALTLRAALRVEAVLVGRAGVPKGRFC